MLRSVLKGGSWIGLIMLLGMGTFLPAKGVSLVSHSALLGMILIALGCVSIAAAIFAVYWRHKRYGDGPTTDEREQWISARAQSAAGLVMMIVWGLACWVPYAIATATDQQTISFSARLLPSACIYGMTVWVVVYLVAMRLIRGKELRHGQN